MLEKEIHCIMPPSPELQEEIAKAKHEFLRGKNISEVVKGTRMNERSFSLILNRPPKTRAHTLISPTQSFASVIGTRRALVLLVDFSDKTAVQNQSHFNDMLFSVGTYPTRSMRDFYKEVSYNQLDVTGIVSGTGGPTAGWYRAPQPKSYYTDGNFGFNAYPKNAQKLVEDVIALANPHVNFADYDNDGDGVVDALVIITAGSGGEATGNVNDIWSHKWSITPVTYDGVKIISYFMAPEDGRVGVMSHELGHLLMGWPDLYDTDYSSSGTGRWDLMAGGSWNDSGNTPAHPTCWCKFKVGWINPVVLFNAQQSVTIKPYAENSQAYKLPVGNVNSKEYFLLSNRQKTKFDNNIPGEGLIIEHIDENRTNNTDENHYLVDIEQCDGKRDLNLNANSGDSTDPYPDSSNNKFTASTTPNSKAYDGADSKISITNINRSGDDITADINAGGVAVIAWHYNKLVKSTFASYHSKNAWAYIETFGWRRIYPDSSDGVTNMFLAFCEAQANGLNVDVQVNDQYVFQVQERS